MVENVTILILEDDPSILMGLSKALTQAGYSVISATNGQEGLARMSESVPDLILADIMMPIMDGFGFYRELRAKPEWELIPFIFLTARGQPEEIREGMRLGVDDYLPKPFEIKDVLDVIDTRLRRARGIRRASQRELQTLKDSILTMLGHELRTPVTFIKGYSDLAMMEGDQLDAESMMEFLRGINVGSQRLSGLIDQTMRVVEIKGGQAARAYEQRKVRLDGLAHFITEVVSSFEPQANASGLTLQLDVPAGLPVIEADIVYLRDVLDCLLDNAIKFSSPSGTVEVRAAARDGAVAISIADQGRGIPVEEFPFVFDVFRQVDRERHEQQGAGLGLAIARGLVEIHGGRIEIQSEVGVGSTFTIVLPAIGGG